MIRDRHIIAAFYIGLAFMAIHFGVTVWRGGSPIKPTTYGAAIYEIPALTWVAIQFAGAMAGVVGAIWCFRSLLFVAGLMCFGLFMTFAVLGLSASDGILLVTSSLYIGVPAGLFTMWRAVRHE